MPFIPHTDAEIKTMLDTIGAQNIHALFDEIPENLRIHDLPGIPEALSEMEVARLMQTRGAQDRAGLCFIGAGAYDHHIPSAVLDLISRGEFLTAYTPYQAEASQGTLQLIYEYQTMMASLTGMDVSNASLYEGASALAEAVLMAVRLHKGNSRRILIPASVHPYYRAVLNSIVKHQNMEIVEVPYHASTGKLDLAALTPPQLENVAALVIPQPNFFGVLEEVDALADWAQERSITRIALVNPMSLALLKEPGQWGKTGVDIVCGEGQPLGVPMASGGPYFGFLCCKQAHVRQMPGRIVGATVDLDGKPGFTLTLQAREQHIRRSKATSNICTNQGLMVTAATIYMSLLGPQGLQRVARSSHHNAVTLHAQLTQLPGVTAVFHQPFFHEFVIRLETPVPAVLERLADAGIQGGFDLTPHYPDLAQCLLVCTTETKTEADLAHYVEAMRKALRA
jgi:glycine dehydrogenase subunit 1